MIDTFFDKNSQYEKNASINTIFILLRKFKTEPLMKFEVNHLFKDLQASAVR